MHGEVADRRHQGQAIEVGHFQVGQQEVAGGLAQDVSAASPSATETTLTSMPLSCSATQRRTDALSSAWTMVLLIGPWS